MRRLTGCLFPTIFRNLNSPSVCSFDVDLYLIPRKKKSCVHYHCVLPIVSLMLLQVWLELLKPITKQVKSKYGRSLKEYSPQFMLEKYSYSPTQLLTIRKREKGRQLRLHQPVIWPVSLAIEKIV